MGKMNIHLESLRPRQWTKNLLLLAGVIFAQLLGNTECVLRAVAGVAVFCLASGVIYVFNDIADRELDRLHPYKRLRPVASGRLPVRDAVRFGLVLLVVVLAAAFLLGTPFAGGVAYNASKFGLLGMTEAMMLDLRYEGIRVSHIMPGSVDTDFGDRPGGQKKGWALTADDVSRAVLDLLRYPGNALPSRIELRPSRPPRK